MKSWKKLLKEDIDRKVPNLRDDIQNYPIPAMSDNNVYNGNGTIAKSRKPVIIGLSSLCTVILAFVIIMCSVFIKPFSSFDEFIFTIEINPSVTLTTDKGGKVTGIISSNADADVILNGTEAERKMKGKKIGEAVMWYTDKAARLGYLNVQTQSAIRISACTEGEKILQATQSSLEHYFTESGIYSLVIAETVNKDEFLLRSGIETTQNAKEMVEYIKQSEPLFAVRNASGLTQKELSKLYETYITTDTFIERWAELLESELANIMKSAKDIQTICSLYSEIYHHKDNPATLLKDYWNVKKYYGTELSGEFGTLIKQMDVAIEGYKSNYGFEIANETQMLEAATRYAFSSVEKFVAIIEQFSAELFVNNVSFIADLLTGVGVENNPLVSILALPESETDFAQKISDILTMDYSFRESKFETIYSMPREKITAGEYEAFRDNILKEFGSLNNFWDSLK